MIDHSKPNAGRKAGLQALHSLRNSGDKTPVLLDNENRPYGYVALSIPELDAAVLRVRHPELASKDRETFTRAWNKFILSPESEPYRVSAHVGVKQKDKGIIIK